MKEWARREVELASANEESLAVKNAYVDAYTAFCSVFDIVDKLPEKTAELVLSLTERLMNRDPLTPILDTPEEWKTLGGYDGDKTNSTVVYTSVRRPSLFKRVICKEGEKEKVEFADCNRQICIDINEEKTHTDPFAISIFNEMCPITFPYFPSGVVKIYTEEFVTSPGPCKSDTMGILYFRLPDGQMKKVMRFFKKEDGRHSEIDQKEYCQRKVVADKLKLNSIYGKGIFPDGQ